MFNMNGASVLVILDPVSVERIDPNIIMAITIEMPIIAIFGFFFCDGC